MRIIWTYNKINTDKILLETPKKKRDKHISNISYDSESFLVKTNKFKILNSQMKSISLDVLNSHFYNIIIDIENRLKYLVYKNSKNFFNDVQFTKKEIDSRFLSSVDNGILNVSMSKITSVFDCDNNEKSISDIKKNFTGIGIVNFKNIWFSSESFGMNLELIQVKYFNPKIEKLPQCIIENEMTDSEDDIEDISENEQNSKVEEREELPLESKEEKKEEETRGEEEKEEPKEEEEQVEEEEKKPQNEEEKEEKEQSEEEPKKEQEKERPKSNFFFF